MKIGNHAQNRWFALLKLQIANHLQVFRVLVLIHVFLFWLGTEIVFQFSSICVRLSKMDFVFEGIMVMGLEQKMCFCEGLMMMMMMKGLDWIWKWVFFLSPENRAFLFQCLRINLFSSNFNFKVRFFFSSVFCFAGFFLWRLMKVDEEEDEEVEWRWWLLQTLTVF